MSKLKLLFSETIIYGSSTILVRFLNWMLMPYYIRKMSTVDYGVITYFYSIIAILLVLLTFGMETGFFKFAKSYDYKKVLSTSLSSVGIVSIIFLLLGLFFIDPIQSYLDIYVDKSIIIINLFCLAIDAFTSIIFAKLRYESSTRKYFYLRILNVLVGLGLTIFYLDVAPRLFSSNYSYLVSWFYQPNNPVYYAFLANLLGSVSILFFVIRDLAILKEFIDFKLFKKMIAFSLPMLGVGITGMINLNLDKIILPKLLTGDNVIQDLAVYGANFKIGLLMAMFAQSFRMAFEPFCFKYSDQKDIRFVYADVLKYFTIFGIIIFLFVLFYIDIISLFLTQDYLYGTTVIPLILLGQLFSGIFYSQSLWYKLSDRPIYGLYLGFLGGIITVGINIIFVPIFGFIASAWAGLICFFVMVVASYLLGQHFYPIPYQVGTIILYITIGFLLFYISKLIYFEVLSLRIVFNTTLLSIFLAFIYWKENIHHLVLRYVNAGSNSK